MNAIAALAAKANGNGHHRKHQGVGNPEKQEWAINLLRQHGAAALGAGRRMTWGPIFEADPDYRRLFGSTKAGRHQALYYFGRARLAIKAERKQGRLQAAKRERIAQPAHVDTSLVKFCPGCGLDLAAVAVAIKMAKTGALHG